MSVNKINHVSWKRNIFLEWIPRSVPVQEVDPSSDRGRRCSLGTGSMHAEWGYLEQKFRYEEVIL
jgi:hypothetical protein